MVEEDIKDTIITKVGIITIKITIIIIIKITIIITIITTKGIKMMIHRAMRLQTSVTS